MEISALALGVRIAQLREAAGLKQAELARQVTWSQAVLSRVEAGERALGAEELADLLEQIGTPEAQALKDIVVRQWHHLPAPPLDHADQELLWAAEETASALTEQIAAEDIRPAFSKRLEEYLTEIRQNAALLLRRDHGVAFIGAIGIGKSTAICKATALEVVSPEGQRIPVLETGGGGITLCEVSLKVGPGYGVIVTPRTSEEVRADVADFAELLLGRTDAAASSDDADENQRAVPRELERAIRNLSNLRPSRSKGVDGKSVRVDPAKNLASELASARELTVEILSRMDLPRRDRREEWFDASSNKSPLEWLKDTFEQINNGRHPDFALPAHVDLVVPQLMDSGELNISVVDTRGIDRVAARADLEGHLLDSHTVSILCSGFNDAPSQPVQHLLQRAGEIRNPLVGTHAGVLVLARPGEALAVKDEVGLRAESEQDGYELKGEQVSTALAPFGRQDLPVEFFNSFSDDPSRLSRFMIERIEATREEFRRRLLGAVESARAVLANVEMQQVLEVQKAASRVVGAWLSRNEVPPRVNSYVHEALMSEMRAAHVSTVNAAVRREGEWYSLSYSHQLGFGARRVAVASLRDWMTEFGGLCSTLSDSHPEASDLLGQAARLMDQAYEDLLKKMQVAGASLYGAELQRAQTLWSELAAEWGKGAGYRDRVAGRQGAWFGEEDRQKIEAEVLGVLRREWLNLRGRISAIFDSD
jgi:transcriptional regulator with XRE-family HTH domain